LKQRTQRDPGASDYTWLRSLTGEISRDRLSELFLGLLRLGLGAHGWVKKPTREVECGRLCRRSLALEIRRSTQDLREFAKTSCGSLYQLGLQSYGAFDGV
jgi:hypothetical protein